MRYALGLDAAITREIQTRRHAITSGAVVLGPLDSHRDLLQLKVAGVLALVEGRLDISPEDWQLAGVVVDTSVRVRSWVEQRIAAHDALDEDRVTARTKRRAAAAEQGRARDDRTQGGRDCALGSNTGDRYEDGDASPAGVERTARNVRPRARTFARTRLDSAGPGRGAV
ncbi:MAG: hypothetical protein M3Q30_09600 [Actinomycetota bacterium]|nr:hypothetical protein [Actinomycetota bacterium]